MKNEDDAKLNYDTNARGGYALVNTEERNSWGMPRGYGIHPGYSPIYNVSTDSIREAGMLTLAVIECSGVQAPFGERELGAV